MITKEEIKQKASLQGLNPTTIEKDYVLGWVLLAVSQHPILSTEWVFKGGTCLKKCYFQDYRFSEDCDFTILNDEQATIPHVQKAINEIALWITKKSGINIDINRSLWESVTNLANQTIIQGRIFYNTPMSPQSPRQWPRIKFDLTSHEKLVFAPEKRPLFHGYTDHSVFIGKDISCYNFYDIFSEKIRALFERTRPRDLYDVVEIYNRSEEYEINVLRDAIKDKCKFKGISALNYEILKWDICEQSWKVQLAHQMNVLSSFQEYKTQFESIFYKLGLYNI